MPLMVSRTQPFRVVPSGNQPDYPIEDWVWQPDLSAVTGWDVKYWILTGDVFTLMDQAARDAVDAAELSARLDAVADEFDQVQSLSRAFAEAVLDEVNTLRAQHSLAARTLAQLKTAVRNKLNG